VVGASGGGKSTLVQVLIGLYPPTRGTIAFDGVAMDRIGMDVVRENVVTVLQHPAIFNDTLRSNLTLGRPASDEALWEALTLAQLRQTVESLPLGLETVLGRFGMRLSGGQRQRIAIARMILSDPKVVILDEATSALDNQTEARLYHDLHGFLQDRTTLIIAHRLSAIRQADRVLVFEDGRIIEQGDHAGLIAQRGLYAKLHQDPSREARDAPFKPRHGLL
jgi:ATP-binding cassette subfamily C protein